MTWVRIQPEAPVHSKSFRVGLEAFGFDVAGLAYCVRLLTDGFVPESDLGLVFPGVSPRQARRLIERLVSVGRWVPVDGGWRIHDYDQYQPTAQDIIDDQAEKHRIRSAGGKARASMATRIAGRFVGRHHETQPAGAPANNQQPAGGLAGVAGHQQDQQEHQQETSIVLVSSRLGSKNPPMPPLAGNGSRARRPGTGAAALGWASVRKALKAGMTSTPEFRDPHVARVLTAMGGWHGLRRLQHRDVPDAAIMASRKEFVELYAAIEKPA